MLSFENELFVREERNGITVYEKKSNLYKFYQGLSVKSLEHMTIPAQVHAFLQTQAHRISTDIAFSKPFRVNWLIEERCNLDCIYCFAHDKMKNHTVRERICETAEHILSLGIMNVGLSGGEPTLNPYLPDVIRMLKGRCSINIDTNGTLPCLGQMAQLLKDANVLVRITIDALDEAILNKVRPGKASIDQRCIITENIRSLLDAQVPLMIHTVITQYNKHELKNIARELIRLGVKRWHMYGVNYAEKCKHIYDQIKLTRDELYEVYLSAKEEFGNRIEMSVYFDEGNYSANSVLLIDSDGKFYLDSISNGIHFIGEDSTQPSLEEINSQLDVKLHCKGYLWTPDVL